MPLYTYECKEHGAFVSFENVEKRELPKPCPQCGKDSKYTPTFETQPPIFKGYGFYETDYKKKGR